MFLVTTLPAQQGGLDILDGETLWAAGGQAFISQIYRTGSSFYRGSAEVADPLNTEIRTSRTTLGFNYGVFSNLTLSGLAPFVHTEVEFDGAFGRETDRASGLGDITLLAKYRVWKRDWHLGSFNWTAFAGTELPTGRTDAAEAGIRLAPRFQPGSGSWDPLLATAATYEQGRFKLNGALVYQQPGEGSQDYRFGELFVAEITPGYRVVVEKFPGPLLRAELGLQWRRRGAAESGGMHVANSGGDVLLLRPALVFWPRAWWGVVLSGEIPVWQDWNGSQVGLDNGLFLSLSYRF